MTSISPSARLRPSPYYLATLAEGVTAFTTYNRMLLPTAYGAPDAEYWRLINGVSMWDVACERQVELVGPDAARLAQILSPRDLSKLGEGKGRYVAVCDHEGHLLNDPVLLKLADDRFWFSIADSDLTLWATAIAHERKLNVQVREADVSPLAVQGPKAEDVVVSLFDESIRKIGHFGFETRLLNGMELIVQRSGWSKQGGFELYLQDSRRGTELWNIVKEAGQPWGIGPGNPNWCERIESGLLSYGGDTDAHTNPFEVRMERFVDLDIDAEVIGLDALRRIKVEGPKRHLLGVVLDYELPLGPEFGWNDILRGDDKVGDMTNGVWSRRLEKNIGFALLSRSVNPGDAVSVMREDRRVEAEVVELPFI